jgi:hypothetical protein
MRYACRTGYHERCPGRWCTCPCHLEHAMRPTELTPDAGPHDAPSGQEEAEALELGGRVAIFRCYQSLLFDAPADYA